MTKALLVVDIQNDYFPGGAMELVRSPEAANVASRVQQSFRQQGLPVFNIQHVATGANATFFVPGTAGVEIHQSVKPASGEQLIVKHYPNSFRETGLLEILRKSEVKELVVVGMMTHMCIDTTVRAANDFGFSVTLVANACATKDLTYGSTLVSAKDVQAAYLAAIDGSFAKVITA